MLVEVVPLTAKFAGAASSFTCSEERPFAYPADDGNGMTNENIRTNANNKLNLFSKLVSWPY